MTHKALRLHDAAVVQCCTHYLCRLSRSAAYAGKERFAHCTSTPTLSLQLMVEVNTGGKVFFCFFRPAVPGMPEGIAVVKFGADRLLMQAEQFANEITRLLDTLGAPDCRIVRKV